MRRLLLLLGLTLRLRLRGFVSTGASSILLVIGALFYFGTTCVMGVGAYMALSASHNVRTDRVGDMAALLVTLFGVFFVTRPLILSNLAGASLQNLLHLPVSRGELLGYSLLTGVVTPLVLESPVLIGAALGAASQPALLVVTLPLALITHLTLLTGAHAVSLGAILMARRAWIADTARLLAFSVFFLPSLFNVRAVRQVLRPLLEPVALLSPLGWAPRATVYAGAGEIRPAFGFVAAAVIALGALALLSMSLLNRILDGEGGDPVEKKRVSARRVRVWLPGALGALIETQIRAQLRSPAARMALLMPTLMMGFFAFSLSRQGSIASPAAMIIFLSMVGGNAFLMVGRGIALILGTPVSRAFVLVASDVAGFIFRVPPLLAIIAVTAWRGGAESAAWMLALALALVPISMGVQHFVSIMRPFALPRDRFNPYAQRVDSRQAGHGVLSLLATFAALLIASPFLLLVWLSSRIADGAWEPWILVLACLGALAAYAVLITLAERLFLKREMQVVEVLLDDSPA